MARKKSVNIGEMTAYLDEKTGYIRLTSRSKGILRKEGLVLNVKPGTHEHSLLIQAIEEKHGDVDLEGLIYTPPRLAIKQGLESPKELSAIPLGENALNGETYYWKSEVGNEDEISSHLLITGEKGAGKTSAVINILDHLTRFPADCEIRLSFIQEQAEAVKEMLPTTENISFYPHEYIRNPLFHNALTEMNKRYLFLDQKAGRKLSREKLYKAREKLKPIYIVIDSLPWATSEGSNTDILADLIMLGGMARMHVVLATTPEAVSRTLTEATIFEIGQKVHYDTTVSRGLREYRAQATLHGREKKIVPYLAPDPNRSTIGVTSGWHNLLSKTQPNALPYTADKSQIEEHTWKLIYNGLNENIPLGMHDRGEPVVWLPSSKHFANAYVWGSTGTGKTNMISVILEHITRDDLPRPRRVFCLGGEEEELLKDTNVANLRTHLFNEEGHFIQAVEERDLFTGDTYIIIDESDKLFTAFTERPQENAKSLKLLSDLLANNGDSRETVHVIVTSQMPLSQVIPEHLQKDFYLEIETYREDDGAFRAEITSGGRNTEKTVITPFGAERS